MMHFFNTLILYATARRYPVRLGSVTFTLEADDICPIFHLRSLRHVRYIW